VAAYTAERGRRTSGWKKIGAMLGPQNRKVWVQMAPSRVDFMKFMVRAGNWMITNEGVFRWVTHKNHDGKSVWWQWDRILNFCTWRRGK